MENDETGPAPEASQGRPQMLGVGIALGVAVGTAIGVATDNVGLWLPIGVALGVAIGSALGAGRDGDRPTG
ncbi:HPP family protein [Cellulomonas sp. APG4]|uniref:HPP family protein n=1 Tax=Cellulomonas sp. APG4 TaxID=1538656 RepID=UPI00192A29AF|nr:HPP family protein [Cellulomonas sp. APG4]